MCECGKAFKRKQELKVHTKAQNEKTYICTICQTVLKSEYFLKDHMQIHGDKIFPCPKCDKSFAKLGYMTVYFNKVHGKVNVVGRIFMSDDKYDGDGQEES